MNTVFDRMSARDPACPISHRTFSLSKLHKDKPWGMNVHGERHEVRYWPGESHSGMFGGNSNWRGPICEDLITHRVQELMVYPGLAVNFLLIESLQRFYQYYGDDLQVECPTGSGEYMNLVEVAEELQHRIIHIFGRDAEGRRATNGGNPKLDSDPHFRDYVWFYEVRTISKNLLHPLLPIAPLCSFSMQIAAEGLERHIRQDGERIFKVERYILICHSILYQVGPSCLPYLAERSDMSVTKNTTE